MRAMLLLLSLALGCRVWAEEGALDPDAAGVPDVAGQAQPHGGAAAGVGSYPGVEAPQTDLDRIFYYYGTACFGLNWKLLKAVAQAESGLSPKKVHGKYEGLFQWWKVDCHNGEYKEQPNGKMKWEGGIKDLYMRAFMPMLSCDDLLDPESNTAVSAHRLHRHFKGEVLTGADLKADSSAPGPILKGCGGASLRDQLALTYVGHNNGPWVMDHVIDAGKCVADDFDEARKAMREIAPTPEQVAAWRGGASQWNGVYDYYESGNPATAERAEECNARMRKKPGWDEAKHGHRLVREGQGLKGSCINGNYGVEKWIYGVDKVVGARNMKLDYELYPKGARQPQLCPAVTRCRVDGTCEKKAQ